MNSKTLVDRLVISPNIGLGPLRFGLFRSQVRVILGGDAVPFKKGAYAETESDACDRLGLHLHYDSEDRLECIEGFAHCPIYYDGLLLLNANASDLIRELADLGLSARYDDGYFVDDCGFALYAPLGVVQAVTVYRKGYYDETRDVASSG